MRAIDVASTAKAFLGGGLAIGGAKYVSRHLSPMWAALVGGLPTGIMTAMFVDMSPDDTKKYYRGYILQSIVLIVTIVTANLLLWYTSLDPFLVLVVAIVAWLAISVCIIKHDNAKKTTA